MKQLLAGKRCTRRHRSSEGGFRHLALIIFVCFLDLDLVSVSNHLFRPHLDEALYYEKLVVMMEFTAQLLLQPSILAVPQYYPLALDGRHQQLMDQFSRLSCLFSLFFSLTARPDFSIGK